MNKEDLKQLDLLAVFHYVVGAIVALFSCMPFIHVFMGFAMISGKLGGTSNASPPEAFGWIFVVMGSFFILFGWLTATCIIISGRKLMARKNRLFCMVIAGLECMFMPFGTVLGVFTLIILNKDSVKAGFDGPIPLPPEALPEN